MTSPDSVPVSPGTEKNSFRPVPGLIRISHLPEVLDLKINSVAGIYDVVADTNRGEESTEWTISFDQLDLPTGLQYVVFDFWKQKPMGIFSRWLDLSIESHDSRVLFIHPLAHRPQLIGNSRHISDTYSILRQQWNSSAKELDGESAKIKGGPYTLWFLHSRWLHQTRGTGKAHKRQGGGRCMAAAGAVCQPSIHRRR